MKALRYISIILLLLPMTISAQINKRMISFEIGKLNREWTETTYVKQGEFRINFNNRIYDQNTNTKTYMYSVITRNQNAVVRNVLMNNYLMNFANMQYPIEILKMGYTIPEFVYIERRDASMVETGQYKYTLHIGEAIYGPYDAIVEVMPNGFVCKNLGVYSYKKYNDEWTGMKNYCVLDRQMYTESSVICKLNGKLLKFNVVGNVKYYQSHDGHYYLLYNDKDMERTFMVVDSVGYELDSNTNDVLFHFSHDGNHWTAATSDYVIVDGLTVARYAGEIKDVNINNKGQYMYVVKGEGINDKIILDGNVLVKGVELLSLTVDDDERFNFIFRNSNGYSYGIDNIINDFNANMEAYYYPSLFDSEQTFTVSSDDGKHTMSFGYDKPYVVIDGERIDCNSIPHYAAWSDSDKSFLWNAVEGSKLLIYKYKVKK